MNKYFDIFIKAVISASGIMFFGGVIFMIKTVITFNVTVTNIENRLTNIEKFIIDKNCPK